MKQADLVIVGGAIMGASVAYFLKHDLGFKGSVVVIEKDPTYTKSSTTLSAASIRQQFSTPENIALSQFGLKFISELKDRFGPEADIGFHEGGYLMLASEAGLPILQNNHTTQIAQGADIDLMTPDRLKARFPWLNVEDLAAGAFGTSGEGWFDAHMLLDLVRKGAIAAGALFLKDEVVGLEKQNNKVTSVKLSSGDTIACGAVVNCAGPAAASIASMLGIPLPIEARKRTVFVIDCKTPHPDMPLMVDTSGVYIRPEGNYFISGVCPSSEEDIPVGPDDLDPHYDLFEEMIWPSLYNRMPGFDAIKMVNAWAGHYEYCTLDQNAIIGAHPEISNFYFNAGYSGHGLQHAPGAGRAIGELFLFGEYRSLDASIFGYERIVSQKPVREINVI
ncbi:NAD(P)/FAD-dependent oxidoreductase [Cohaesibacter celericrescens]|uniref:FAD-dependent oxidoreductase n=1 Tax=Cohaesibacter celericrescens TaxID=2067669 RepID=A0A2N5XPE9_9HYPH|nr:FAD-binding oxidoreductase [Cohaesibacter celericrescens]PLW76382.1 FAD-dependent oxidoreductase [Cohaesibacter celericrescens]